VWLLSSVGSLHHFEYFKSVFLKIQASAYMVGFPKSGHIWALDITNSSQFDGQVHRSVVWRYPARWVLVHSHHCHLKTTQVLEYIRQAQENSPMKSRSVNHWLWYRHGSWCSNWVVVKSVPFHLVGLANLEYCVVICGLIGMTLNYCSSGKCCMYSISILNPSFQPKQRNIA